MSSSKKPEAKKAILTAEDVAVKAVRRRAPKTGKEFKVVSTGTALPASAAGLIYAMASDPEKAQSFLKDAGILTKAGKLSAKYAA